MAKLINNNKLNTFATKLWAKISNGFVSKTQENLVTGKTTLLDGRLLHNALSVVNNTNAVYHISENSSWCGSPNLTVSANTKISYVCIAVKDDLEIGTQLNNIKLAAVKSNDNQVYRILTVNSALVVKNTLGHISSSKMIMIPVNTAFDTQVYFIAGFNGMKWGNTPSGSNWPTIWPEGRSFPAVGTTLRTNLTNYIPQWFVLSEELSLNDVVTSVNTKASKNDSNTFDSTNIFNANVKLNDVVDIKYKHYIQQLLLDGDSKYGSEWVVYFDRNIYIPAGSYVTYLDIRVTDDVSIGSELSEIYIYEVGRGDNIRNDSIVHVPFSNSRLRVANVDGFGKCIRAQLNKTFERDTYFIMGQKMATGKILVCSDNQGDIRYSIINSPFVLNSSYTISSIARGTNSKTIHRYNIERVGILQDDINNINNVLATTIKNTDVANEANKIPRIGADGRLPTSILPPEQNGGVRTVNEQSPVNGNVTVLADHIKYVDGENTTVKGAIDNKVNVSDTVTSSQAGKIVKLDDNGKLNDNMLSSSIIKSNQANTFTKLNSFNGYSPTVHRLFTRKHINSSVTNNSNLATYQHNKYFAPVNEVYTDRNKRITHLLLPVRGASVGEQISIDVFAFNNNKRLMQLGTAKKYPVVEEEIAGCKCVKIDFDIDSGTSGIGFGFMIMSTGVGAVCVQGGSNMAWTSNTRPTETTTLNPNENISFPYKICYETTSELVTRFELENVTQMYPKTLIGEYKNISYDAGNTLDDGMNTWLKANGQTVTNTDYPELFEKINPNRTINDLDNIQVETFELPNETAAAGYYYICAK
ncbi:hypothetical protein [uncultured Clostridium sp.]|uniref:hypothetical protein n=1 Tax=uncultured Clostridium sp. TaxID=59620 RepID=UPI0025CF6238|nr:hypothetical protein [uncultured Clostridium sp.]